MLRVKKKSEEEHRRGNTRVEKQPSKGKQESGEGKGPIGKEEKRRRGMI